MPPVRIRRILRSIGVVSVALASLVGFSTPASAAEAFEPLPFPQRVLDTRANGETADGINQRQGPSAAGATQRIRIAGRAGVPRDASDAILNVTAVRPDANGFLTVFACGAVPNASNVNYVGGENTANTVIALLDDEGDICVFSSAQSDILIDVSGTLAGRVFEGLPEPRRILDTRTNGRTFDGADERGGSLPAGAEYELRVADRAGVASDPTTVVINVTAAQPSTIGFVTVWPCGARPGTSNLNYTPGRATANAVASAVSGDGTVCLYTSARTDLIIDVAGTLASPAFTPLVPGRIADTRAAGRTIDGEGQQSGLRPDGGTLSVRAAGRAGVPSNASAVIVNVTAAGPLNPGFVTVYPRGVDRPTASNLNYVSNSNTANVAVARLGMNGEICLFNSGATQLIVDVIGYFTGPPPPTGGADCPADPMPPPAPPPPPPPPLQFSPGQYTVNEQIPPGRYVMEAARSGCYWERQNGFGGTTDEINANDFRGYDGRVVVDILASDLGFDFDGDCGTMTNYTGSSTRATNIVPGSQVVDEHIAVGTYRTNAVDGCYWQRISSFDGDLDSIIANDFVADAGPQIVTIDPSDEGFESNDDCGTWTLV